MAKRCRRVAKRVTEALKGKVPECQKKPVSKKLLSVFVALSDNEWQDEKLYEEFKVLANKHLGDTKEDRLEHCRLVVGLSRMKSGTLNTDWTFKDGT
jgi:hypothetical protein